MSEPSPEDELEQRRRIARQFIEVIPHARALGMRLDQLSAEGAEISLPWREDLVGDPETGVLASGPIVSMLDNATSMSVWALRGRFHPQVTLDLRVDYVRAATPGKTVFAWAECYRLKRSMAFVRGLAHDGDIADPVAHAAGIFIQVEPESWAATKGDAA